MHIFYNGADGQEYGVHPAEHRALPDAIPYRHGHRGVVVKKNSKKNILLFPDPPEQPPTSIVIFELGNERVVVYWELKVLRAKAPLLLLKRPAKTSTVKI